MTTASEREGSSCLEKGRRRRRLSVKEYASIYSLFSRFTTAWCLFSFYHFLRNAERLQEKSLVVLAIGAFLFAVWGTVALLDVIRLDLAMRSRLILLVSILSMFSSILVALRRIWHSMECGRPAWGMGFTMLGLALFVAFIRRKIDHEGRLGQ